MIAADTNLLVRVVVRDNPEQADAADALFDQSPSVLVSLISLCEFVWVLRSAYRLSKPDIAFAIEQLLRLDKIVTNRPAVEAGLKALGAGADFADWCYRIQRHVHERCSLCVVRQASRSGVGAAGIPNPSAFLMLQFARSCGGICSASLRHAHSSHP